MRNRIAVAYIFVLVLLMTTVVQAQQNKIYEMNIKYSFGNLTLESIVVNLGFYSQTKLERGYSAEIKSFEDQTLHTSKFTIPNEIIVEDLGIKTLDEVNFTVILPFFDNAKEILITDPNGMRVLKADISVFSKQPTKNILNVFTIFTIIASVTFVAIILYAVRRRKTTYYQKIQT